jgi:hypothetical protein
MIITIDPGVHACALAYLENAHVQAYDLTNRVDRAVLATMPVTHVVAERPEYQGLRTQSARPADLIALSWSGGLMAGTIAGTTGAHLVELPPSAWKGSEPKPVQHARMWAALTANERDVLGGMNTALKIDAAVEKGARERWKRGGAAYYPRAWKMHNVLDAVGLGLFYVGRMAKR